MTDEQRQLFLRHLADCVSDPDIEEAHARADQILCDALIALGEPALVEVWADVPKWYA